MPVIPLRAWLSRVATERASSRAVALVRIGVPLLLWTRFGSELAFFSRPHTPVRVALGIAFFVATALMLIGLRARLSALSVALVMTALIATRGVVDGEHIFLHHHVALLVVVAFLLALTPCGASFSIDRMRALARARAEGASPPEERGYVYGQWLIRAQLVVIYLFAAIDKSNVAFLSGVRMQHYAHFFYIGSTDVPGAAFPALAWVISIATVVLEYTLAALLLVPRARRFLIPIGLAFHAILYVLLPVHTFSLTMALLYVCVLDPDEVHARIDALVSR